MQRNTERSHSCARRVTAATPRRADRWLCRRRRRRCMLCVCVSSGGVEWIVDEQERGMNRVDGDMVDDDVV